MYSCYCTAMYSCYCTLDVQLLLYGGCTAAIVQRMHSCYCRQMYSFYCTVDVQLLLYGGCTAVTVRGITVRKFTVEKFNTLKKLGHFNDQIIENQIYFMNSTNTPSCLYWIPSSWSAGPQMNLPLLYFLPFLPKASTMARLLSLVWPSQPRCPSSLGHGVPAAVKLSLTHTTSIFLTRTKVYGYTNGYWEFFPYTSTEEIEKTIKSLKTKNAQGYD